MKLSFLGQFCEASTPAVETVKTSETATSLGKSDDRKHFAIALRHSCEELTYRGVRYHR